MIENVPREIKLLGSIIGLYASFLNWGYLHERLSSTDYSTTISAPPTSANGQKIEARWNYVLVLNCCMAITCCLTALPFLLLQNTSTDGERGGTTATDETSFRKKLFPDKSLALAALSHTLASPFGYISLSFINYPMLLLVKSSKLVPIMLVSYLLNGKRYSMTKITSVVLISIGVALFSCKINPIILLSGKSHSIKDDDDGTFIRTVIGFALVSINLLLDGFTNARQDRYREKHDKVSSFYMMYQINAWQVIYMSFYLIVTLLLSRVGLLIHNNNALSQLDEAVKFMMYYPPVMKDVALFSLCGATGQVFIFFITTTFGSLLCVLITLTRKFVSIMISVMVFGHVVLWWQWIGVACVFSGLFMNTMSSGIASDMAKEKKKVD